MEPPMLGDDGGAFGGGGDAYFGLGTPTPMDLNMNGHAPHPHRQSVGHVQAGELNLERLGSMDGR
jgi:hypothetical protein